MSVEELINQIEVYNPDADFDLLRRSYEYSEEHHSGQQRRSGHPYFTHCLETAKSLIDLKLDVPTICAGLLHDVLEDTLVTRDDLAQLFGESIAQLVEGVTKIGTYHFKGRTQQTQADNYLNLFLATAKDIRVILIKLADRLHNMETLSFLPIGRQQEIAKETLEIYASLAHRLGINRFKSRLEDLAFKYLHPLEYREIASLLAEKLDEREAYTRKMEGIIGGGRDQSKSAWPPQAYIQHLSQDSPQRRSLRGNLRFDCVANLGRNHCGLLCGVRGITR